MKRFTNILFLAVVWLCTIGSYAQPAVTVGSQVTAESSIVSGKAYILQYVGNNASYVQDADTYYNVNNVSAATEATLFFFISNGDGTWKIKNYYTGKYWGAISGTNNLLPSEEVSAGSFSLNFSSGQLYPTNGGSYLSRSGGKLHGWASNSNSNFKVYEVGLTSPVNITSGWYQIKWVDTDGDTNTDYADADVNGKYVRNYAQDVTVNSNPYPLYLANAPATISENAASLVHFDYTGYDSGRGVDGYLRSANGHYVTNTGAASITNSSKNYIIYRSSSTPYYSTTTSAYTGTRNSLVPCGKEATPYIGQTVAGKFPVAEYYKVEPSYLGLQPWTVSITGLSETVAADNAQVTYSGSDSYGLTSVYNGGTFFLTSGVTPSSSEFSATTRNGFSPTITVDATNYAIQVNYDLKSNVYTINNTNTSRGALIYNSSNSNYVWSSGKSGTFDATAANSQWVIYPTGTADQYYLYNVGAGKFVVNTGVGTGAGNPWMFSDNAAPVTLTYQSSGTYAGMYKIKAANGRASDGTNNAIMSVSNGQTYPIINYDDAGSYFTITKVTGDASTAATAAYNKLVENQTALTEAPSTSGWYALQIKTSATSNFVGRFVKTANSEYNYSGQNYPLTFTGPVDIHPAITDATYFTYIDVTNKYWQLPNGKYLMANSNNKFPVSTSDATALQAIGKDTKGIYFKGNTSYYATSYRNGENYFIGESTTYQGFEAYPINLTTAGLTAWQVTISGGPENTQLTCTRSDVSGLTSVYNNGYFFLPSGTTPASGDFSLIGMTSCTVDATNHTITIEYDPGLSLTSDDVTVVQGHQTTGKGNTMQPLLRIKATPFTDFQPTQFSISLSGADQVDNVKVYSTTVDQINFAGVTPTLLGTADSPSDGTVDIDVTSSSVSAGTTMYYWITADVKSTATEWETIDAHLSTISYTNAYKTANSLPDYVLDVSSKDTHDGVMRIYKSKSVLWTSSTGQSQYYRIPALLKTGTNTLLAFSDDRFTSKSDLGGNHKIDVLVKKSTDDGATWGSAVTVAAGDGSTAAGYGYGDAAVAQAANGDIVCLMAAGNTSYAGGMLHIGYTKSTDGGATWSAVTDLYGSANLTNNHTFQSTFVSSGHGITQTIAHPGRIAFPALGKISGATNEYVIYSDDNGATWTFTDNYGYAGADESKLEEMNDGTLLMSIRTGGFSSSANRGYNRTTDTDVESWGTQGQWSDLYANGCNSDLFYYSRLTDGAAHDVLLHTVVKSARSHNGSSKRYDLRLYMSFDGGATWKEAFQLQPGWAAYSSMQKLDNGDLAILFEDGSIGNEDMQDCYDISYVVISNELLAAKISELDDVSEQFTISNGTGTFTSGNSDNTWFNTWTSTQTNPTVTLSTSENNMQWSGTDFKLSGDGGKTYTITLPENYCIDAVSATFTNGAWREGTLNIGGQSYTFGERIGTSSQQAVDLTGLNCGNTLTFTLTSDAAAAAANKFFTTSGITIVYHEVPMVNFKNTSSNQIVASSPVPVGTSSVGCVAATVQGDLSPLVSYGTPTYDYATNSYTVPYTVQSPAVESPTWYFAQLRSVKFMSYDPMAEVLSGYGHPVTNQMTTFNNEYHWAIVGDPYDCVKIYNYKVGTSQPLATITKANNERLHFAENDTTSFQVSKYNNGFVFRFKGQTAYLNDVQGSIGRWNSSSGATDAGSVMTLIPLTDFATLQAYVPGALTNYASRFFTGNNIGFPGDFPTQQSFNSARDVYVGFSSAPENVSVGDYNAWLNSMVLHVLQPITTGNYRLLNVGTSRYLGFNEAFGIRGYSGANGTNADEGYSTRGQALSTIWHIDVSDEGTLAAPVVSNSGCYLNAVTTLEGSSAGDLAFGQYPLSFSIGVNNGGVLSSSSDNITPAASGHTGGTVAENNGSYLNYVLSSALWKLIPAEETTFTLTANVLGDWSFATFYAPFDARIETEDTYAYWLLDSNVDRDENSASMTVLAEKDGIIPAGTPVVLINKSATTSLEFTPMNTNTETFSGDNIIRGTYERILFDDSNRDSYLIFGKSNGNAGFFKPKNGAKLLANRCYLDNSTSSYAMGFKLFFLDPDDSTVTAVPASSLMMEDGMPVYDLQGRRVEGTPRGGVYIIGGKKVYVK